MIDIEQKLIDEAIKQQKEVKRLENLLSKAKQERSIAFAKMYNFMNETGQVEFDKNGYRFKVTKESTRATVDKDKVKALLNEEQYNSCLKHSTIESSLRLFELKKDTSQLEKVNNKIKQHVYNNTAGIEEMVEEDMKRNNKLETLEDFLLFECGTSNPTSGQLRKLTSTDFDFIDGKF